MSEQPTPASGEARVGALVLVGTPLGRLSDASPGMKSILAEADVIAAEDTRRLRRLAADLGITLTATVLSYFEAIEAQRIPGLVQRIADGQLVALATDAGMPSVSDPGYRLVAAVAAAGLTVTSVPGPSAVITALALSGLPSDRFTFEGFPPRKAGERKRALAELRSEPRTMVFFESVHRIEECLAAMVDAFGADRPAAVCRELTKTYEEVRRGPLGELSAWAASGLRGELTIVIAGSTGEITAPPDESAVRSEIEALVTAGRSRRDAVDEVAAGLGLTRKAVYAIATTAIATAAIPTTEHNPGASGLR